MPTLVFETKIATSVEKMWQFHSSAEALRALTPPGQKLDLISADNRVENGAIHIAAFRQFGIPMIWEAHISEVEPPFHFRDTARKSPFRAWTHLHEFIPTEGGTLLRDTVTYKVWGGALIDFLVVRNQIRALFKFRHAQTAAAVTL